MTKQDYIAIAEYIKRDDKVYFEHLIECANSVSLEEIGYYINRVNPDQAEQILANVREGA